MASVNTTVNQNAVAVGLEDLKNGEIKSIAVEIISLELIF